VDKFFKNNNLKLFNPFEDRIKEHQALVIEIVKSYGWQQKSYDEKVEWVRKEHRDFEEILVANME
jgi:hypothetical protein